MAAKRKRNNQHAAAMTEDGKRTGAGAGSDDEFDDDDREPTEAVAPDGSIIKLPQVRRTLSHLRSLCAHITDLGSLVSPSRRSSTASARTPTRSLTTASTSAFVLPFLLP
jgi:hypothetical protein